MAARGRLMIYITVTAAAAITPEKSQPCHSGRYPSEIIGFAKNSNPFCGLYGVRLQAIKLNR